MSSQTFLQRHVIHHGRGHEAFYHSRVLFDYVVYKSKENELLCVLSEYSCQKRKGKLICIGLNLRAPIQTVLSMSLANRQFFLV